MRCVRAYVSVWVRARARARVCVCGNARVVCARACVQPGLANVVACIPGGPYPRKKGGGGGGGPLFVVDFFERVFERWRRTGWRTDVLGRGGEFMGAAH